MTTDPDDTTTVLHGTLAGGSADATPTEVLWSPPPRTEVLPGSPARTEILHPPGASAVTEVLGPARPGPGPTPAEDTPPEASRQTVVRPAAPAERDHPPAATREPGAADQPPATRTSAGTFAVYLVAVGAAAEDVRRELSGFLDQAGRRSDPLLSVGSLAPGGLHWQLRRTVPYDVRLLPRFPPWPAEPVDAAEASLTVLQEVAADLHRGDPAERVRPDHTLVLILWGAGSVRGPRRFDRPVPSGHLVDLAVDCVAGGNPAQGWSPLPTARVSHLLSPVRPGAGGAGLLQHCGRLFHGWPAFAAVPAGLRLVELLP